MIENNNHGKFGIMKNMKKNVREGYVFKIDTSVCKNYSNRPILL